MNKLVYLFLFPLFFSNALFAQNNFNLLIGTYTNTGKSEGIYVYDFNTQTAALKQKSIAKNIADPSFLALSPDRKFVYCVNQTGDSSNVSAFRFNAHQGALNFINKQKAVSAGPCHITADQSNIIIANYAGGSMVVFNRHEDGSLSPAQQLVKLSGKSITPNRQDSPHAHMTQFTPDHKFIISTDLGSDKIRVYKYSPKDLKNTLIASDSITTRPGSGPRHFTFDPKGKFVYLLNEIDGSINVFSYHNGTLKRLQELDSPLKGITAKIDAADIHISPDGKFLYASNRGDANNILVFSIQNTGKLIYKSQFSTQGKGPRNFAIDPSGNYLLVAHQYTDNIVIFKRNKITGSLSDTGKRINIGAPVCLLFTPVK